MKKLKTKVITSLAALLMLGITSAASITWNPPAGISGTNDISHDGAFVDGTQTAINSTNTLTFGDAVFTGASGAYSGNTGTSPNGNISWYASGTDSSGLTGSGPAFTADYNQLIHQDIWLDWESVQYIALNNLTVGDQYQVQIWVNAGSGAYKSTFTADNAVTLNSYGSAGNLGQYVLGTFTADATTENITFSTPGYGILNAVQLRDVTGAVIPTTLEITQNPVDAVAYAGQTATLSVGAVVHQGNQTNVTYQWLTNGVAIVGGTLASYTTPPITTNYDSSILYKVIVSYPSLTSLTSSVAVVKYATTITWSDPQTISGTNDVSHCGTYVDGTQTSGNTVTTLAFDDAVFTGGSGTYSGNIGTSTGGKISWYALGSQAYGNTGTGPGFTADYNELIHQNVFLDCNQSAQIGLNNLTIGHAYLIQIWANYTANYPTTFSAGNAVTLNTAGGAGGLGQFVNGTFTANATSKTIGFSSTAYAILNAIQLRDVTGELMNSVTLASTQVASATSAIHSYSTVNCDNVLEVANQWANLTSQILFSRDALAGLGNADVTGATLTLTSAFAQRSQAAGRINLYELVPANAGFTANGNWNTKDGSTAWAGGSSGASIAGTDYVNTLLGSAATPAGGLSLGQKLTFALNAAGIAVIQSIVDGTDSNPGFVLVEAPGGVSLNAACFYDGIHGNVAAGPSLAVVFNGTFAPGNTLNFGLGNAGISGIFNLQGAYVAPSGPVGIAISAVSSITANLNPSISSGVYNLIMGAPGISASSFYISSAPPGYTCTLSASNGTLSVNVVASPSIPTIPLGTTVYAGSVFSFQIPPVTNSTGYGASGLPSGVTLNPVTGVMGGTPNDAGTYFATIASSNVWGATSSEMIFVVPPAEGAPALSTAVPRGCFNNVAESTNYTLVYSLNIPSIGNFNTTAPAYSVDTHASIGSFSRVAYYLELQAPNGTLQYVWASMNPFTSNAAQIGVPTTASGANFQQTVTGLNVFSDVAGVVTGTGLSGIISYSPLASGSMEISNAGGTLFGFTNWAGPNIASLGIGGALGSAAGYSVKSLQVFVLNSDTTRTVQPVPDNTTLLVNPGKGWVDADIPYDQASGIAYTVNGPPRWVTMEPAEGVYDWSALDSFIAAGVPYGIKVGTGVMNIPAGIPTWVFQPGTNLQTGSVYTNGATGVTISDTVYNITYTNPATWDEPVYLARMKEFITALGQHYNGNPNIAYFAIYDSGYNGEGITTPISLATYENGYVAPYIAAFPNTRLMISVNGYAGVQYLNDNVPSTVANQWFIAQGGALSRNGICSEYDTTYASELLLTYPHTPARLEYAYTWADTVAAGTDPITGLAYASPAELLRYVLGARATYVQLHAGLLQLYPNFCDMLGNLMGYYFTLQQATIPKTIQAGLAFPLSLTWLNNGIAPLYEPCSLAVALLDANNNPVQQQWLTTSNPNGWMPWVSTTENFNITFPSVPSGYKLAVGLFSKQTDAQPSYRIGNQGRTATGWYILSGSTVQPTSTWINASGGSWKTAGNWTGSSYTNGIDATADFSTLNLSGNATVTLDGNVTVGTLLFGDTTPSHNWTLGSGTGGTLTLRTTRGMANITVNNQTTTISAPLTNYVGLAKNGSGTLALNNRESFYEDININGGVLDLTQGELYGGSYVGGPINLGSGAMLQLAGNGAFGWGANPGIGLLDIGAACLVINGGTINFTGTTATGGGRDFTIGTLGATFQSSQSGGALTISGGYTGIVTDNSSLILSGNGTGGGVFQSVINGTGSLIKIGSGTWALTGSNNYTGVTTVSAGRLAVGSGGSISNTSCIALAGGAVFDVSGLSSFTLGSGQTLSNSTSTGTMAGNLNTGSGRIALTYAAGIPSLLITNGTLTLSSNTLFLVNNTGGSLATGSYKLIAKAGGIRAGLVAGTVPTTVRVGGGGTPGGATLQIIDGELYLNVGGNVITGLSLSLSNAPLRTITADGISNYSYILQRKTNLTSVAWFNIVTNLATTNGPISLQDSFKDLGSNTTPAAFYRLLRQP